MIELRYDEWMNDSDSVLWHIERDPSLRSTITAVWFFESTPDRARMDAVVDRAVAAVPRLRQRVVDERPGIAPPRWVEDPHLDVDHHYWWSRLPGRRVGQPQVFEFAQRMAARAFDKDRPLWELCVIEGLTGHRAAFVMKIHHAIADGLGLVELLSHMIDLEADPPPRPDDVINSGDLPSESPLWALPGARPIAHRIRREARIGVQISRASARTASELLRDPRRTIERLGRTTGSIARVVKPTLTPLSPLMTDRSINTNFDVVTESFADFKAAARAAGGSINDAFIAATLDAFGRYHEAFGTRCERLRLNMPVSVRGGEASGRFDNQIVPARMVLPVSGGDAASRIAEVRLLLQKVRAEPALPHVNEISGVIGRFGPAVSATVLGAMLKGVDITASNVPGPSFPVFMAGSKIEEFFAFGPPAGAAVNITLFSYDGRVHLGINTDRAAVTDRALFRRCMSDAVDAILQLAEPSRP